LLQQAMTAAIDNKEKKKNRIVSKKTEEYMSKFDGTKPIHDDDANTREGSL
jgi:hypothetical protein